MRRVPAAAALAAATGCACGGGPGRPDGGADAGATAESFGLVKFRCYEYVEGEVSKPNFDLGVVSFTIDTKGVHCPAAGTAEVHLVRYYQTGVPLIDYLYVDGNALKKCRRDYASFSGDTYKYGGGALTLATQPVRDNDTFVTVAPTEVRDPEHRIRYQAPFALEVTTIAAPALKTPTGPVNATRFIYKESVADGGTPDAPPAGTPISEETRYFVPGTGWAGIDIALDQPGGTLRRFRLQSVRTIQSLCEALNYPCGGPQPPPDGGSVCDGG